MSGYLKEGVRMILVMGIGPGTSAWVVPEVEKMVQECEVLLGGGRALELFSDFQGETYQIKGNLREALDIANRALSQGKKLGVLVSGDPGFYSLLPVLQREFPEEEIRVLPGISSLQLAFARAGVPWQEAELLSVHGRPLCSLPLNLHKPLGVLTGGENTPQKVAQYYQTYGFNPRIFLGKDLSYPEEQWLTTDAQQLMGMTKDLSNAVLLIYPETISEKENNTCEILPPRLGIKDEEFHRANVPMTKSEIRVQVLAKAGITAKSRVLDVGAGTGSISIEAALIAYRGCVYAVEKNPEAQELILTNQEKFGVNNLRLIRGTAPEALVGIPLMDVCIIGGSQGRIHDILQQAPLVPGGRAVITAVTLETVTKSIESLRKLEYQDIDVVSIQAVRWQGLNEDVHLAQALNPVFIISGNNKPD